MRWSIIRLIWLRELRDQLRDRRTIFMIAVLPILLYPALGVGVLQLAVGMLTTQNRVGIYNTQALPQRGRDPISATAWFSCAPLDPGNGLVSLAGTTALVQADQTVAYPPLLVVHEDRTSHFEPSYFDAPAEADTLEVKDLGAPHDPDWRQKLQADPTGKHDWQAPLTASGSDRVDVLIIVPEDFQKQLEEGRQPEFFVWMRPGDDAQVTAARLHSVLSRWRKQLKEVRLIRRDLPPNFDEVFKISDAEHEKSAGKRATESLADLMGKIFPFMLVMWSLAGALYPAVDLCAGEKERGTMETLLISPVSREEIVYGKFLAIWVFSGATALLNLLSMAVTTWQFASQLAPGILHPMALLWCVVLVLPLSAFFSALCLSVGAYARSSKEGQYYLMPLFLITMPLIFLTLSPKVKLDAFYSMVPVTGVALLLQELMTSSGGSQVWYFFVPVLAPMVLYSWLALRWAVGQFKREEVLFREAERLDVGLWLKRLLREKERLPSSGQAIFCFVIIMLLRWFSFGFGTDLALLTRSGVSYVAFVLAPPLLMALVLTTRPRDGLSLRMPPLWAFPVAVLLAVLLLPPLAAVTVAILRQFEGLQRQLTEHNPLTQELSRDPSAATWWEYVLVLALLPAVCEELAFRGFILNGLRRYFRPWAAVLLSSFLFAAFHMNVFQFIPAFVLGVVLALLAMRTGSVLPGMLFHLLYNVMLLVPVRLAHLNWTEQDLPPGLVTIVLFGAGLCALLAIGVLWQLVVSRPRSAPVVGETTPSARDVVLRHAATDGKSALETRSPS